MTMYSLQHELMRHKYKLLAILNGSDSGTLHVKLLGFWTLSIGLYSPPPKKKQRNISETKSVCFLR